MKLVAFRFLSLFLLSAVLMSATTSRAESFEFSIDVDYQLYPSLDIKPSFGTVPWKYFSTEGFSLKCSGRGYSICTVYVRHIPQSSENTIKIKKKRIIGEVSTEVESLGVYIHNDHSAKSLFDALKVPVIDAGRAGNIKELEFENFYINCVDDQRITVDEGDFYCSIEITNED